MYSGVCASFIYFRVSAPSLPPFTFFFLLTERDTLNSPRKLIEDMQVNRKYSGSYLYPHAKKQFRDFLADLRLSSLGKIDYLDVKYV